MATSRKHVLAPVLGILAVGVVAYLRLRADASWNVEAIRVAVGGRGAWAPIALVVLIAFRWVFLVPSQVALLAAGMVFGFVEGTLYGMVGVALSGLLAFAAARTLGTRWLKGRVPPGVRDAMDGARPAAVGGLVFGGTVYPVGPMSAFHFGAGLTCVGVGAFVFWVTSGALVRAALFTYLGESLVEHGVLGAWPAWLALCAMLAPLLHPGIRARVAARIWPDGPPALQ